MVRNFDSPKWNKQKEQLVEFKQNNGNCKACTSSLGLRQTPRDHAIAIGSPRSVEQDCGPDGEDSEPWCTTGNMFCAKRFCSVQNDFGWDGEDSKPLVIAFNRRFNSDRAFY
jgi:hypothetical protein